MKFASRSDMYAGYEPKPRQFPVVAPTYAYDIDRETGKKVVVKQKTGTNFYQQIQESKEDTLIYNVIDRINRTGDYSLLGENMGGFFDATVLPKDLLAAKKVELQAKQFFDALPSDVRSKEYGNDFDTFIKTLNTKLKNKEIKTRAEILAEQQPKEDPKNE